MQILNVISHPTYSDLKFGYDTHENQRRKVLSQCHREFQRI